MIETDKYEGHTEGPWVFKHINSNWYDCDKIGEIHMEDIAIKEASANAQLISDAPLLLEEVKRLNNIISTFDEFMCKIPQRYTEGTMRLWNELLTKEEEE